MFQTAEPFGCVDRVNPLRSEFCCAANSAPEISIVVGGEGRGGGGTRTLSITSNAILHCEAQREGTYDHRIHCFGESLTVILVYPMLQQRVASSSSGFFFSLVEREFSNKRIVFHDGNWVRPFRLR